MKKGNQFISRFLGEDFWEKLEKSNELYKLGTQTALDPEEIRIGLKVVPRAVMSFLISELVPMQVGESKQIPLPIGTNTILNVNKGDKDSYSGSVIDENKPAYDFRNRSIPGIGIILLSTFELYDLTQLDHEHKHAPEAEINVQKLIDERMEQRALIEKVVDQKMSEREAIHKMIMNKLSSILKPEPIAPVTPIISPAPVAPTTQIEVSPSDMVKKELSKAVTRDKYGPATSTGHEKGVHTNVEFRDVEKPDAGMSDTGTQVRDATNPHLNSGLRANAAVYAKEGHKKVLSELKTMPKPNLPKSEDGMVKKKGSPLKEFLDRKKPNKEFAVQMEKSETIDCPDCSQTIFGDSGYSGCICMGSDQHRKIWLKKTEDGVKIRFSRGWDADNMELLLEVLRSKK